MPADSLAPRILRWLFIQLNKPCLRKKYYNGSLSSPFLSKPVKIVRDTWHVPHIYAENRQDLFFAQGFIHAQDRLWQLEMSRRIGKGTLAEVFGEIGLKTDRLIRTLGFNRLAIEDLKLLSTETRTAMDSFSEGINWCVDNFPLPVEFKLTKIKPEPWKPADSLAWGRVMSWTLSHGWSGALTRSKIIEKVGEQKAAELNIFYPENNPIELPNGLEFNKINADGLYQAATGPFLNKDMEGGGRGSNAWAISAKKSITGHPILCNDTHLPVQIPSVWYLNHLITDKFHVTGAILPGLPGIILGHNEQISWGITLSFLDMEDIFIEKLTGSDKDQYKFKNDTKPLKLINETIKVKNQNNHIEMVKSTHHGPLISSVTSHSENVISLSSKALQPNHMMDGFLQINSAQNWDEFASACQILDAPPLNFVYADKANNIGLWVTGKVPIRKCGDGQLPVPGWTGEGEWVAEIPAEHMPHLLNPEQGYIISCNNKVVDNYPYFLGNSYMNGYRARRIEDVFISKGKLSIKDCIQLHSDFTSIPGKQIVEGLLKGFKTAKPKAQKILDQFLKWDFVLDADSTGAIVYQVFIYHVLRNLVEHDLGPELTDKYMGKGEHPLLLPTNELLGHTIPSLISILQNPNSNWISSIRQMVSLVENSLENTCSWLEFNLGFEPDGWSWGRIHQVNFRHGLTPDNKLLSDIFNIGPFEIGGDTDTVCQTAYNPTTPYNATEWCPAIRVIMDLRDFDKCLVVLPPGQSGVLGSPHYNDMVHLWLQGEYIPMPWTKECVNQYKKYELNLDPVND